MRQLLTLREVERRVCLKRSSIYRAMRATPRSFPLPIKIGPKYVRWIAGDIEDWLASRPRATGELGGQTERTPGSGRPHALGRTASDSGGRHPIAAEQHFEAESTRLSDLHQGSDSPLIVCCILTSVTLPQCRVAGSEFSRVNGEVHLALVTPSKAGVP